ncbi:hypothetical protein LCGC14_0721030 [marine sediment metagenome]|uniref:DUF362 domain-containing protein n=1 Tax=marine sediment metagenome TaxID=412755 RepID=A0A0F9QXE0_9ZZZZ|nr:DUF362 domain-containing protein [archaeon]
MSIPYHKFGQITIAKVSNSDELKQIMIDPWLESETIIIKPNWVSAAPAAFIDSKTMRMMLEALDSHIVVTESHTHSFNLLEKGMSFTIGDKEVNWEWFITDEGWNWFIENPDWGWFKKGYWDQLKKMDKAFLDEYGFTDLFKEFDVSYINVTDEVWNERIADPTEVKNLVESRFKPVQIDKLYTMVPKKLYDLRGSTFISFAKLKHYASFTIKNIFGMIPDPMRPWWHGLKNSRFISSIIDINKIYHSLFNVYGICEALNATSFPHPEGKFEDLFMGKYNIKEGFGVVAFGRHLVSLDAILLNLTDQWTRVVAKINRLPINMAQEEFGAYDREALKESKLEVGDWLSP